MTTEHRPDVKGAVPLETQHITAECRTNQGLQAAFELAVVQLRQVYYTQWERHPEDTISLAIYRTPRPEDRLRVVNES